MKHLRKRLLTLLALTLFGGMGAWAQQAVLLTTITPTSLTTYNETTPGVVNVIFDGQLEYYENDGWQALYGDGNQGSVTVTAKPGFSIDSCKFYVDQYSYTVTAAPFAVYPYCDGSMQEVYSQPNAQGIDVGYGGVKRIEVYGTAPAQEIELTPDATGKVWTLGQTPDYDLELQVEYYQPHALKDIPAGWTVMVNGVPQTQPYQGDSLLITETDTVTLIPDGNPRRVKSVTLVEPAPPAPPATPLDNTTTAWADGSRLAVPAGGLTYSDAVTVSGNVTLVLTDGETLTLNKGISLASGATLTVEGTGTMNVNGTNNNTSSTVAGTGTIVLTSGTLNAKGGNGAGVGDHSVPTDNRANAGGNAINGNVTVSGGTLTATGGNGGGVGAMSAYSYGAVGGVAISGSVTVTGGAVTATGGNGGSIGDMGMYEYGGNGGAAIGGDATISGGTWTATDGTHGVNGDGQGGAGGQAVAGTVTDNRN